MAATIGDPYQQWVDGGPGALEKTGPIVDVYNQLPQPVKDALVQRATIQAGENPTESKIMELALTILRADRYLTLGLGDFSSS